MTRASNDPVLHAIYMAYYAEVRLAEVVQAAALAMMDPDDHIACTALKEYKRAVRVWHRCSRSKN